MISFLAHPIAKGKQKPQGIPQRTTRLILSSWALETCLARKYRALYSATKAYKGLHAAFLKRLCQPKTRSITFSLQDPHSPETGNRNSLAPEYSLLQS